MATRGRRNPALQDFGGGTAGHRAHLSAFSGIPELLESLGVPSAPLLQGYDLTEADLHDPDRTGSFRDMSRLLERCVRATRCPYFGLLLSRTADLHSLGLVGRLARHSPTVGEALCALGAYFPLHDTGGNLDVAIEGDVVTFRYTLHATGIAAPEQAHDFVVGVMVNVMRQLCGAGWQPSLVMLPRKQPQHAARYREVLGDSLQFDAARTAVAFPARWLSRPVPGADPILHRLLLREVRAGMDMKGPLICGDVRQAIVNLLHEKRCSRGEVARALGLHERTLCRSLQASGTTFQHLLDEVRSGMALLLLRDTRAPMSEIADELGFRNSTVMARAFRRWNGMSPRDFRNALQRPH